MLNGKESQKSENQTTIKTVSVKADVLEWLIENTEKAHQLIKIVDRRLMHESVPAVTDAFYQLQFVNDAMREVLAENNLVTLSAGSVPGENSVATDGH